MTDQINIKDFLLKEYENIVKAYFDSREITTRWFKYYMIIIAFPFTILALSSKNYNVELDILHLDVSIRIIFCSVGIIGVVVTYIINNLGLDTIIYARTVNGIRKYFVDNALKNKELESIKSYIVLPVDINLPEMKKYSGSLFCLTILTALINTAYIVIALYETDLFWLALFVISFIAFHILILRYQANKKESKYIKT